MDHWGNVRLKKRDPNFGSLENIPAALNKRKKVMSSSMDDILKYVENESDGNNTASSDSEIEELNRASKRQKLFARKTIKRDKKREKDLRKRVEKNKISMDDFWCKQSEFKMWLVEEKCKSLGIMTSPKLKAHFKTFIRAWNKKKLPEKYYRGSSTFCNSPSTNKKYKILEDEENQPFSMLFCDNKIVPVVKESPFVTFGKTPSKIVKSKKGIFGSTSDVALISVAPIESPILYKRPVSSKKDNQYIRPAQNPSIFSSVFFRRMIVKLLTLMNMEPDLRPQLFKFIKGFKTIFQHTFDYTLLPMLMVEEERGEKPKKEPLTCEKLLAHWPNQAQTYADRPAIPTPYKVSVYPWAVDPANSADQNLELCSTSTPPGGIFTKMSNMGIEKESDRAKKSSPEGSKAKSGTVDSPPLPPPPPPLRSDLLIINDTDYFPPPPELDLCTNYADPYDLVPCKGRSLIYKPDSEYHEPMDTLNKHGTQRFQMEAFSSRINSRNKGHNLPSKKPYELSTLGEKPAGYKTVASNEALQRHQLFDFDKDNYMLRKKIGKEITDEENGDNFPRKTKGGIMAASTNKIYETYLNLKQNQNPFVPKPEKQAKINKENAYKRALKRRSLSQPDLSTICIDSEPSDNARVEELQWGKSKQRLLWIKLETAKEEKTELLPIKQAFESSLLHGNTAVMGDFSRPCKEKYMGGPNYVHISVQKSAELSPCLSSVENAAVNESNLPMLTEAENTSGLNMNRATERRAGTKSDLSGLSQTLISNDTKTVYAAGRTGLSNEIKKVNFQGADIKWDSSGSSESLFSNDSKKAADRGSGSSGKIKKVGNSQRLSNSRSNLKCSDILGAESMCTVKQGLSFPGNDLEKEILSSESGCKFIYDKADSHKQTLPSIILDHNRQKTNEFSEDDFNANIHELEEQSSLTPDIVSFGQTTFKPATTPGRRLSAVHGVDFSAYLLKQPFNQNEVQNDNSNLSGDRCPDEGDMDGQYGAEKIQHQTGQRVPQEDVNDLATKSDIPKDSSLCKSTKQITHLNKSNSDRAPVKKPALGMQTATAKVLKQNPKLLNNAQKKKQQTARRDKSKNLTGKVLETDIDEAFRETKKKMHRSKSEGRIGDGTLSASSVVTEIW